MKLSVTAKSSRLLVQLGCPHLKVVIGGGVLYLCTQQEMDAAILQLRELLSDRKVEHIRAEAKRHQLPPNLQSVRDQIREYTPPQGFKQLERFELCTSCGVPIPHGYVLGLPDEGENRLMIPSLQLAYRFLTDQELDGQRINVVNVAELLHQMAVCDELPLDQDDVTRQLRQLGFPKLEEIRRTGRRNLCTYLVGQWLDSIWVQLKSAS